ncbi:MULTISPECIES: transcription antitermination factor NusB [unclassified Dysgonomonas]|uniref:transcription antitermination factor NusB n=1 Tax=unclassified Dysgonomonas TaxID=2630389 RepID=UPI0013ECE780|nr:MULTISPECIES: transcription antitermination factor NusB [unclassified Dysgonomonas]
MINRVLIRIRVVQILFSCNQNETNDLKKAENELLFSLQKSYDLYFYLLLLLIELTDAYEQRVDARKAKLLPTQEDMSPNTKLLENKFINQLRVNRQLNDYLKERPFDWTEHDAFLRNTLDSILASEAYQEYSVNPSDEYDVHREFWRNIFKHIICVNEDLYTLLEDESLFWNDDVEIVESFVIKTIKRFDESKGSDQELLPMFKDETDREFAVQLLKESMLNAKEYRELIDRYTKNWESERIAIMDMIIMQIAISEIMTFPSIPINVTLNEYIDVAKSYSTVKSASFINGILDAIVKELKEKKRIFKK